MDYPKVSIIILNWNGLKDTLECLDSLKKITYPNYGVIVVDNGSLNNEAEIIQQKYPGIKVIKNPINEGFCKGNNIGAKFVLKENPEYWLFLNNDTIVRSDFLVKLIQFTEANPEVGAATPLILYYNRRDKIWSAGGKFHPWFLHQRENTLFEHPRKDLDYISGCAFLIKKRALEKVGLWDTDYATYLEDIDYSFRIKKADFKIACVPQSVIYHKVARANIYFSKKYVYYMVRNNLLFAKKNLHWSKWPLWLVNFLIRRFFGYFFKLAITKNWASIPFIFWGVRDFIFGQYGKRY